MWSSGEKETENDLQPGSGRRATVKGAGIAFVITASLSGRVCLLLLSCPLYWCSIHFLITSVKGSLAKVPLESSESIMDTSWDSTTSVGNWRRCPSCLGGYLSSQASFSLEGYKTLGVEKWQESASDASLVRARAGLRSLQREAWRLNSARAWIHIYTELESRKRREVLITCVTPRLVV